MIGPLTPPKPQQTRFCILNACCDVAFRMAKLRRPSGLCKISELNSIATLLPNCLRLTLPVASQSPRLANGGSLHLAMRVFHPPNYPPFSGRAQPFTAPSVRPLINCFCINKNSRITGSAASVRSANTRFQLLPPYIPKN